MEVVIHPCKRITDQLVQKLIERVLRSQHYCSGKKRGSDYDRTGGASDPHQDGMGKVATSLALQTHGPDCGGHISLRGGLIQGRLANLGHLGGHKEWQHTLGKRKEKVKDNDPSSSTIKFIG